MAIQIETCVQFQELIDNLTPLTNEEYALLFTVEEEYVLALPKLIGYNPNRYDINAYGNGRGMKYGTALH